ncbi:MAG: tetratricopeptide repeat protein [Terracidiphilus sp.]|jgi:TPR repeat protein
MEIRRLLRADAAVGAALLLAGVAPALLGLPFLAQMTANKGMDRELLVRANAGDATSQYLVGFAYQNGVGVPKDLAQAAKWFLKAADGGNPRSMEILGTLYEGGLGGLPKDDVQAVSWYRKAAEAGRALSMARLGSMYEAGRGGVAKDDVQAESWYRKAAEAGNGLGMVSLGAMYSLGRGGLAKDDAQAVNWYRNAAEAGDASGMRMLGIMYVAGRGGLTPDKAQAVDWLSKAVQLGDVPAQRGLAQLQQANIGCLGRDGLSGNLTPVDLYRSAASCVDQEKYDDGLLLYALAGAYGRFDISRVKDATAHDVVAFLPAMFMKQLEPTKAAAFKDRVKQMDGNDAAKAKYCSDLESMSPPAYFPGYMVSHGMASYAEAAGASLQGHNPGDNPLVSPFDAQKAWKQAVEDSLQCGKAPEGMSR